MSGASLTRSAQPGCSPTLGVRAPPVEEESVTEERSHGLADGEASVRAEARDVEVYFLFRMPYALPTPLGESNVPVDFTQWLGEDDLRRMNTDLESELGPDPRHPVVALQFAASVVPQPGQHDDLLAVFDAIPDLWPWVGKLGHDQPHDFSEDLGVGPVSLLSVRIRHRDGAAGWEDDQEGYVAGCFDQALRGAQDLQRAISLAAPFPAPILAPADLPLLIPYSVRLADQDGPDPVPLNVFVNPQSLAVRRLHAPPALPKGGLDAALHAVEQEAPFVPVIHVFRDAEWSCASADYWSAVIKAAAFTELLVHTTARHLLWEEGISPEDAVTRLDNQRQQSMVAFANQHLSGRLKGRWSAKQKGPVKTWSQDLLAVRNAVLHAGEGVDEATAAKAVAAANGMLNFIKECLVEPSIVAKYPFTAMSLWGEPSLRRKGAFTSRVERMLGEAEPGDGHRFALWKRAVEASEVKGKPLDEDHLLIAVVTPDTDEVRWVVWLLGTTWAAGARLTEEPPATFQTGLTEVRERLARTGLLRAEVSLPGFRAWERTSDWTLAYHLLPNQGCALR